MKVFLEQVDPRYTRALSNWFASVQRLRNSLNANTALKDMIDIFEQVEPQELPALRRLVDKRHGISSVAEVMILFREQGTPEEWSVFRRFAADNRTVTSTDDLVPIDEVEIRPELAAKIYKRWRHYFLSNMLILLG
jgi:hypothetical protein